VGRDLDGLASGDAFGISISISGDGTSIVVGGYGNDETDIDAGSAQVFTIGFPCPETKERKVEDAKLMFTGLSLLSETEISHFERVTEMWYKTYYQNEEIISAVGIRNLATTVQVQNQQVDSGALPNNTLSYDQEFHFVNEGASTETRKILMRPFEDYEKVLQYVELLAENKSTAFGNIQLPFHPPQLQSLDSDPGVSSEPSESDNLSKGVIAGIIVVVLVLGLVVAGLYVWRQKGSMQLRDDFANLPVGELVVSTTEPAASSSADAAMLHPIVVDVLHTEHTTASPSTADATALQALGVTECVGEALKGDESIDFKDQVRTHPRQYENSPGDSGAARSPDEAAHAVIGLEPDHAVVGLGFKDQADDVGRTTQ